jgi:hypothetical protein
MDNLRLTIGLSASPYTQALFDGTVQTKGIELKLQTRFGDGLDNIGARHREIIAEKIDGGAIDIVVYPRAPERRAARCAAGFFVAPLSPALHVLPR